jgi:RNA polymerase sigma-70 factor (ECF subfamily)
LLEKATEPESRLRDALLVVRCQLGEAEAFADLVRACSGPLLRHVQRIAGHDIADDLVQDIWLRALRGIARLRDGTKLRSWLFGIAHHVVMDRLRVRYTESEGLAVMAAGPEIDAPDPAETRLALLDERLVRLPVVERETLTLFYLEDLSLAQIADIQAVPVGTVKSRLFRARGMLRQAMQEEIRNDE